jgi:hypothetical protein
MKTTNLPQLLIDSRNGIYIPHIFAMMVINGELKLSNRDECLYDLGELGNVENEFYWESWDNLLSKVILTSKIGEFRIEQIEGDLYAIPMDITNAEYCEYFDIEMI